MCKYCELGEPYYQFNEEEAIEANSACWKVGDFAKHIIKKNVIVKITEVNEMSWFKCVVVSDCSYMKNMVYCFFYNVFEKTERLNDMKTEITHKFNVGDEIYFIWFPEGYGKWMIDVPRTIKEICLGEENKTVYSAIAGSDGCLKSTSKDYETNCFRSRERAQIECNLRNEVTERIKLECNEKRKDLADYVNKHSFDKDISYTYF